VRFKDFELGPLGEMLGEPVLNSFLGFFKVVESSGNNNAFFNVERKIRILIRFTKNRINHTKQFETGKRTPYVICAPSEGSKRGGRGLFTEKLFLNVVKEGEERVSRDGEDQAGGGAALDDPDENEIQESLKASHIGDSEVKGEEGVQEEAKTLRKSIVFKNSMNPGVSNARERRLKVP